MQIIADTPSMNRALASPIDPALKRLLCLRRDQLLADTGEQYELGDLVHFILVEPNDTVADIEAAANFPLITEPAFEWVTDHSGTFEAAVVLSDDGFGFVLLVPDRNGIDLTLLTLLRDFAGGADAITPGPLLA